MIVRPAKRTAYVREYYFSGKLREIARLDAVREALGGDAVINLGIGSPDGMPPQEAIAALCSGAQQSASHVYQSYAGIPELRNAFARWYEDWYGVSLEPDTEIQPLSGSKEGILLISLAFLDEGDRVLVPDPGYPTYSSASRLAGAVPVPYDLREELGWQPDFDVLESMDLSGVKLMWTNWPNMPTGAPASEELFARLVDFGRRHGILICNDNPYSFILNGSPLSILSVPHAKECCLELNSLSKAHNMSGWRIGMLAADRETVSQVLKVKSQMDSGMFRPMQLAAVEALAQGRDWFVRLNEEYRRRRIAAGKIFDLIGAEYDSDSCGMFLWGRVRSDSPLLCGPSKEPPGKTLHLGGGAGAGSPLEQAGRYSSSAGDAGLSAVTSGEAVSDTLLYGAGVFITPGFIFGRNGNGYVRISLCADVPVLEKAFRQISRMMENAGL